MKKLLAICFTILVVGLLIGAGSSDPKPQYTKDGHLLAPGDFREWIFLSSGLGMNYNPQAGGHEMFTNVFVPQWAYHEFLKSGKWPDKTMFVVEERMAQSKGSINKVGHFQVEADGLRHGSKRQQPSRHVDLLQLRYGQQAGSGKSQGRLLAVSRRPRRSRAQLRAVLSHAEASREKIWDLQRSAREG